MNNREASASGGRTKKQQARCRRRCPYVSLCLHYLAWSLFVDRRSEESTTHKIKESSFIFEMTDAYNKFTLVKIQYAVLVQLTMQGYFK